MNEIDICKLLNSANTDDLKKRSEITELLIQEGKSAIPTFLYALEHSPVHKVIYAGNSGRNLEATNLSGRL